MEVAAAVLAILLIVALVCLAVLTTRQRGVAERLEGLVAVHEQATAQLRADLEAERTRAVGAQEAATEAIAAKTAAETRLVEAQNRIAALGADIAAATAARDAAAAARVEAEKAALLAGEQAAELGRRVPSLDALKADMLQASKAALLDSAQAISSKLLEDHKRENAEAKQQGEEQVKRTAAELLKQLEQVAQSVAQLQGQLGEKSQVLDTVWRALTNPGGAGYYAEIGLANTLKSFGLEEGRDFVLQHTTQDAETGRRLRPDAIVFLPGNSVLVIDCKASKFLVEIAQAEGTDGEEAAYQNLARTMNLHLRALAEKDYRSAVAAACRASGRDGEVARVLSVMCVPNESAVERLKRADSGFAQKAAQFQIIVASPASLACAIGFASVEINFVRQLENQEKIVAGAERLLDSLGTVLNHAAAVGRGLRSAAESFSKLSGSVSGRLLPRARELARLGVRTGKPLPGELPAYKVIAMESEIEGEAAEIADAGLPAMPRLVVENPKG
jgi:DNA recombination protein RmuC